MVKVYTTANTRKYLKQNKFDIICSNNCFAHIDDIHSILDGVTYCLKPNGQFIIEVHYLKNLIEAKKAAGRSKDLNDIENLPTE